MATIDKITLIEGEGESQTTNTYDIKDSTTSTAVAGLRSDIATINTELTTVKDDVAGLDTSLDATNTTVSTLNTELDMTKSTVTSLNTSVSDLTSTVNTLTTTTGETTANLTALTSKVNAIPTLSAAYDTASTTLQFTSGTVGAGTNPNVGNTGDLTKIKLDGSTYTLKASATNYCKLIYSTASNASTIAANTTIINTTSQGYGLLDPTYNTALGIVEYVKLDKPFKNLAQVRNSLAYITQGNIISIGCTVKLTNSTTTSYSSPLIFHAQPIVTVPTLQPDNVTIVVQARVYLTLLSGLRIPSQGADVVIKNAAAINLNSFNIHAQLIMQY